MFYTKLAKAVEDFAKHLHRNSQYTQIRNLLNESSPCLHHGLLVSHPPFTLLPYFGPPLSEVEAFFDRKL